MTDLTTLCADARPLYVLPDGPTRVELDGPALRITREDAAEQLYPLRRLSRVCTTERVTWTSEALLACAQRGIGVLFVDEDGVIQARLLGRPGQRDELYTRLMEFLLQPQAPGMYHHWLGGMRRRAAYWAGVKLDVAPAERDPRCCRDWINRRAARAAGNANAVRTVQWLRTLAHHWMQSHLQDLGFGCDNALARTGEPPLAKDLTGILMWYLEPARVGWLESRALAARRKGEALRPPCRRELVTVFESRAMRTAVRGREITSALHRWLIHET